MPRIFGPQDDTALPVCLDDPVNREHPLNDGWVAWWIGLEGLDGGRSVYDLMGLYHGTLTSFGAGFGWQSTARNGGFTQLAYDNSASCVTTPASLSALTLDDTRGFSVRGWIRPTTINGNWHSVIGKLNSDNSNRQFWIAINGGFSCPTNGLSFFTNSLGTGGVGTNALTAGRWYYFVASHFSASSGNNLWVWSREGGWETIVNGTTTGTTAVDADAGTNPVTIGKFDGTQPLIFAGQMDDIAFRHKPTSALEVVGLLDQSLRGYPDMLNRIALTRFGTAAAPSTTLVRRTLYARAGSRGAA